MSEPLEAAELAVKTLNQRFPQESDDFRTWAESEELLDQVENAVSKLLELGGGSEDSLALSIRVAEFLMDKGSNADVGIWVERASASARQTSPPSDPAVARLYRLRGKFLTEVQDFPQSGHQQLLRALKVDLESRGPKHLETGIDYLELSWSLDRLDKNEESRDAIGTAVEILEDADPEGRHLPRALRQLSWCLMESDEPGYIEVAERALALSITANGENHPDVFVARNGLGALLQEKSDMEGARRHLEAALDGSIALLGEDHPGVSTHQSNLGMLLLQLEEFDPAIELLKRAIEGAEATLPPNHYILEIRLRRLARALIAIDEQEAALECLERCLECTALSKGILDLEYAEALLESASVYETLNNDSEAEKRYEQAISTITASSGGFAPRLAWAYLRLGDLQQAAGRWSAALASYERALEVDERAERHARVRLDRVRVAVATLELLKEQDGISRALDSRELTIGSQNKAVEFFESSLRDAAENDSAQDIVDIAYHLAMTGYPSQAEDLLMQADSRADGEGSSSLTRSFGAAWSQAAEAYSRLSDLDGSDRAHRLALERYEALDGTFRISEVSTLIQLAEINERRSDTALAVEAAAEAVKRSRDLTGSGALSTALSLQGRILARAGEFEAAIEPFTKRLEVLADDERDNLYVRAVTRHDLGLALSSLGRQDQAISCFREALDEKLSYVGSDGHNLDVALTVLALSTTLLEAGKADESLDVIQNAARAIQDQDAEDLAAEGVIFRQLGAVLFSRKSFDEATEALEIAVRCEQKRRDPDKLSLSLLMLGRAQYSDGFYDPAQATLLQRLALLRSLPGGDPVQEAETLVTLGDISTRMAHTEAAVEYLRSSVEILGENSESEKASRMLGATLLKLGRALRRNEQLSEARSVLEERLALLRIAGTTSPQTEGVTLHDIGNVLRDLGEMEEAAEYYREAVMLKRDADAETKRPQDLAVTLRAYASVLESLGNSEEAAQISGEAAVLDPEDLT